MASSKEIDALFRELWKYLDRPSGHVEGALLVSSANPGDGWRYTVDEIVGTSGHGHCSPRCTAAEMVMWLKGAIWAAQEPQHTAPLANLGRKAR